MSVPRHPLPEASTADVETAPTVTKVPEAVRGVSFALTTIATERSPIATGRSGPDCRLE